jgi:hypothetical protein
VERPVVFSTILHNRIYGRAMITMVKDAGIKKDMVKDSSITKAPRRPHAGGPSL